MLRSDFLRDETQTDEPWSDAFWSGKEIWADPQAVMDCSEYGIALQNLPTEQELLALESGKEDYLLDDSLFRGERRTGLRP